MKKRACWLLVPMLSFTMFAGCDDSDDGPAGTADGGAKDAAVAADGAAGGGGSAGADAAAAGSGGTTTDAGGAKDGAGSDAAGANTTMRITAVGGGTLSSGGASVKIPAGALAADTDITLTVASPTSDQTARGDISGSIYNFGPNGTTFKAPVEIALPLTGTVPADKEAVVAWLDSATGLWVSTPSTVGTGKITGQATHFTSFAVLFVGKGGLCPAITPCGGGVPAGAWEISSACFPQAAPEALGDCGAPGGAKYYLRYTATLSGSTTFTGNRYSSALTGSKTGYIVFPTECIASINALKQTWATCSEVEATLNKNAKPNASLWACAGTVAAGCNCTTSSAIVVPASMGTVTVAGDKITLMGDTETTPAAANDYCLKGNVLTVKTPTGIVYTAVKKQ